MEMWRGLFWGGQSRFLDVGCARLTFLPITPKQAIEGIEVVMVPNSLVRVLELR